MIVKAILAYSIIAAAFTVLVLGLGRRAHRRRVVTGPQQQPAELGLSAGAEAGLSV